VGKKSRTNDHYSKKAKKENYPARSIYKLEEIDRRVRLLRSGFKVLDLGAAPGSWSMYAAKKVGPSGLVVAVDQSPLGVSLPGNAVVLEADALTLDPSELGDLTRGTGFNVVMSDMAPRTSGHRFVDQTRSFDLFSRALSMGEQLLIPGGNFVGKIFFGGDFETARHNLRALFSKVRVIKPASVRSESYEIYLVGLSRR
jgi:23S rRNA (uridine2552-2'-O)-methyltransferase